MQGSAKKDLLDDDFEATEEDRELGGGPRA